MKLRLSRGMCMPGVTIGKLYIDGKYECDTLEDTDRELEKGGEKVAGVTCIPRGTYEVIISYSNRFRRDLPLLLNVPQFTGIRIHPGNTAEDTEGCILVGVLDDKGERVVMSRITFDGVFKRLQAAMSKGEQIWITVE